MIDTAFVRVQDMYFKGRQYQKEAEGPRPHFFSPVKKKSQFKSSFLRSPWCL